MKLGFDIDDTIADAMGFCIPRLNKHFNKNIKPEEVNGRYCDVYNIAQLEIDDFFKEFGNDIFEELDAFNNASNYINKWYNDGHEIVIITARPETARESTVNWLKENGVSYHDIFFDEEKSKLAKDLGIELFFDDHPKVVEAMKNVGIETIFMDLPKNREIQVSDGIYRVKNWEEAYIVIERFLERGGK